MILGKRNFWNRFSGFNGLFHDEPGGDTGDVGEPGGIGSSPLTSEKSIEGVIVFTPRGYG